MQGLADAFRQGGHPSTRIGVQVCTSEGCTKSRQLEGVAVAETAASPQFYPPSEDGWPKFLLDRLCDRNVWKIGADLKGLVTTLRSEGISVRGPLFDTSVAHALLGSSERSLSSSPGQGLKQAAEAIESQTELDRELSRQSQDRVFYEIEMPLIPVLVDMEREGIRVENKLLIAHGETIRVRIGELQTSLDLLAGRSVNMDSLDDLGRLLFEELRICDNPKRTRSGSYATDANTLRDLVGEHAIVQHILDFRELVTLKRTYLDKLPDAVDPVTGRIHTTFSSIDASTGRIVSKDPNLQNIPKRTAVGRELRKAFVPSSDDHLILSADYDQIELRILAALSGDPNLIDAFKNGVDFHRSTAADIFTVAQTDVTDEMRSVAKAVNYSLVNGRTGYGLAQELGISTADAQTIIERNLARYAGVQRYISDTIAFARKNRFVKTLYGRRRYIPEIVSKNLTVRRFAERAAVSSTIQGSAADLIKLAMIGIHTGMKARELKSRLLITVHDELVIDVYRPEQTEVTAMIKTRMENALSLAVPIMAKIGIGNNWLDAGQN